MRAFWPQPGLPGGRIAASQRASLVIIGDASQFVDKLKAIQLGVEVIPLAEFDLASPNLRNTK